MSAYFNPTIAGITVRATLGRRRAFLFAIPAVILIALTLVLRASTDRARTCSGRTGCSATSASRCCCRSPR